LLDENSCAKWLRGSSGRRLSFGSARDIGAVAAAGAVTPYTLSFEE